MSQTKKKRIIQVILASESLQKIGQRDLKCKTKIVDIMNDFSNNSILLAMIFFSLPIAIPLPYPPGFTTIVGIPLVVLSVQMLIGRDQIYLPEKINNYEISNETLSKISNKIVPIVQIIEQHVKPRLFFAQSRYCRQFVGLASLVAALSVTLPFPFTNAVPALGIAVMALGLINRDGIIIILGCVISIIGLTIALTALVGSVLLIKYLFQL